MNSNENEIISFLEQMERNDNETAEQLQKLQQQITEGRDGDVVKLRKVLVAAKDKLKEQDGLLKRLTSIPFVIATAIRIDEVPIKDARLAPREVKGIHGAYLELTEDVELSGIHVGDEVEVIHPHEVRSEVREAKKLTVAGFDNEMNVVTLLDGSNAVRTHQNEFLRRFKITKKALNIPNSVIIIHEGKYFEVMHPEFEVKAGDQVMLNAQTMQIVKVAQPVYTGDISLIRSVRDSEFVEVDHGGSIRVAASGKLSGKLEEGDRVLLDSTLSVIIVNLGKEDRRFSFSETTNITWDDIGGLAEAKKQMIEAIEMPFRHKNVYAKYGKKPIKGILLYGPPGCGKTLLAKAAVSSITQLHGSKGAETGFIYVKGPEILDKHVGVAEATIRQIFQQARKHKETHGYPAVIFIDEADAILGKRGTGISSDMERTIVPMFLAEMDGLEDLGAIVLLSTNRPDVLDPAIVRDKRIDRKVNVGRPDQESTIEVFKLHLRGVPFNNGYTVLDIATLGRDELFSDRNRLYNIHVSTDKDEKVIPFTLGHLINGALIAGIVDQATSQAIYRDISKNGEAGGITKDDILCAINCIFEQNRDLNHNDELAEFVRDFRKDVVQIKRAERVKRIIETPVHAEKQVEGNVEEIVNP